jgi:ADP-ribosylglycohydrolase
MIDTFSRHQKMLLGIVIGDAFGAGYEFRFPNLKDYQNISIDKYIRSAYKNFDHFPGMYTDDTQMSIAVAELLASGKAFTRENLAANFVGCYKRDAVVGLYAEGFQKFLDSVNSGQEFIEKIHADATREGVTRNGAAMRSVPLGLVKDLDTVVEYAKINASLTHNTSKGIASSVAVALMSHVAFYGGSIYHDRDVVRSVLIPNVAPIDKETARYINDISHMDILRMRFNPLLLFGEKHYNNGVPCDAMRTVGAMVYLLTNCYTPKEILEESVKLGGDVDSVASISLGISLTNDNVGNLPSFLYDDLTNHTYGRDYLLALGSRLEKKFPLA